MLLRRNRVLSLMVRKKGEFRGPGPGDELSKRLLEIEQESKIRTADKDQLQQTGVKQRKQRLKVDRLRDVPRMMYDIQKDLVQVTDGLCRFPVESEFLIVGAGLVGQATALFCKKQFPRHRVTVIDRDLSLKNSATARSCCGVRQQFSQEENVKMSLFTMEFMRKHRDYLAVPGLPPVDVPFYPQNYLTLATEDGAEALTDQFNLQKSCGAKVEFLTRSMLERRFPFINSEGVDCATIGLENEGTFDQWAMLQAIKQRNLAYDVKYYEAELAGFQFRRPITADGALYNNEIDKALVKLMDGDDELYSIRTPHIILACNYGAIDIAKMLHMGEDEEGLLSEALPIEARKRYVYSVHAPDVTPVLDMPVLVNNDGVYLFRQDIAGNFICGKSPSPEDEPTDMDLEHIDYEFFNEQIWPSLANRIPALNNLKVKSAWAGFYDYNTIDQNLIIGPHPLYKNLIFACGLSGHGFQHSLAIGRAISEWSFYCHRYRTLDLTRFHFDRFLKQEPIRERNII